MKVKTNTDPENYTNPGHMISLVGTRKREREADRDLDLDRDIGTENRNLKNENVHGLVHGHDLVKGQRRYQNVKSLVQYLMQTVTSN